VTIVAAASSSLSEVADDAVAVSLFSGAPRTSPEEPALAALVSSGEARGELGCVAHTHVEGRRLIVVGLGERATFDANAARAAAAYAARRAGELGARSLAFAVPPGSDAPIAEAIVEGALLAAYRFDRYRAAPADDALPAPLERLTVVADADLGAAVARARTVAQAVAQARTLQNTPARDMTPAALAACAQGLADELSDVGCEVVGRAGLIARGMEPFAAVAGGSPEEPALITLRYEPPDAIGPTLGYVGKAVTFDSGGLSLKPLERLPRMKYDMSGGAAVLAAVGAIARLRLPVRLVAVVGAVENLPGAGAMKPGDVVRGADGIAIEIVNADAEGRLVLSDCLAHARAQGAELLLDVATLTKEAIIALGPTHAALMGSDEAWLAAIERASAATGEPVWRLPLHRDHDAMIRSRVADLVNYVPNGPGALLAGAFLRRFAGGLPWAHLDICGVAYDTARPWAPHGGTGFGVRLLVELARAHAHAA
jgi:leucyl aminopeptidase